MSIKRENLLLSDHLNSFSMLMVSHSEREQGRRSRHQERPPKEQRMTRKQQKQIKKPKNGNRPPSQYLHTSSPRERDAGNENTDRDRGNGLREATQAAIGSSARHSSIRGLTCISPSTSALTPISFLQTVCLLLILSNRLLQPLLILTLPL